MEKVSVFIKIRVLFWPEISALGVFFNFDNERMRPPKYPSAPPPGVSGSKFTNGPSKCSQQIGLLPYYHNLLVIFVIFEKKWRLRKKTAKTAFWNVDLGTLAKF